MDDAMTDANRAKKASVLGLEFLLLFSEGTDKCQ